MSDDAPNTGDGNVLALLEESRACLAEAWTEGHPALRSLVSLQERLRDTRLQLAVLGQFKRGKSTFINALLGAAYLPAAVVPATAIPTFIAWAPVPRVYVTYQDQRPADDFHPTDVMGIQEQLRELVTEAGNPTNRRRIARVDFFVPAEILRDGVVLIDTPGIGSTLRHNTDTAMQVLPECDAALFVVSADPPITEAEIAYLSKVRQHVVWLFFVLNKIDYLSLPERAEAQAFLSQALQRCEPAGSRPSIFLLSARQALDARTRRDDAALAASGLPRIEQDILHRLAGEKLGTLSASVRAKAAVNLDQALADLALRVRALELPLEDLEQRSRFFGDALRNTQGERRVARDLLEGDERRAVEELESQAEQLRQQARHHLFDEIRRVIEDNHGVVDRAAVQRMLNAAVPVFFEAQLGALAAAFRQSVEAMLAMHQARADALVGSVRHTAAALFEIPLRPVEATEPFRLGPEPYWVTQKFGNALMPSPTGLLTRLLPGKLRQDRLHRQLQEEVDALVQQNVENLRWATLRGLTETFRHFSTQFDERLAEVVAVTQGVINQAIERRRAATGQTAAELDSLRLLTDRLAKLRAALAFPAAT